LDAPPIYAESDPVAPRGRDLLFAAALFVAPAAVGAVVGALLGPLWELVATVNPIAEIGAVGAVALLAGTWLFRARLHLPLWRRAASRALLALIFGALAWALLAAGGASPIATGEHSWLLAIAALFCVGAGEAAGLAAVAAPWSLERAPLRTAWRWTGTLAGVALGLALWLGPAGAAWGGAGIALILTATAVALVLPRVRPEGPAQLAPCPRCGAKNHFPQGRSPCSACGLLVNWPGSGPLLSNAPNSTSGRS